MTRLPALTPTHRGSTLVVIALALMPLTAGCARLRQAAPGCQADQRLAIVAQSVPGASYVPCVGQLRQGWRTTGFAPSSGHSRITLESDRASGHPVTVELVGSCNISGAVPATPRADGARTYIRLDSVSPRYAGTFFDVFSGGCVSYRFDFQRGPHIALMEDLQTEVQLYSRRQLAVELRRRLGLVLDP